MKFHNQSLSISPTDLSYFLSCRHRTAKELSVAQGVRKRPVRDNPMLETLAELGIAHEAEYVAQLRASGKKVLDLGEVMNRDLAVQRTLEAMKSGVDAIVQAGLSDGAWYGRPDVLLKVTDRHSKFGQWSYEPADAKLARETRGGTIIQLGVYCTLLEETQGCLPEFFHVVIPSPESPKTQSYRFEEYGAYFRLIRNRFNEAVGHRFEELETRHPADPCDHCTICPWWGECHDWWVEVDHLSLVAGISRTQRRELDACGVTTVEALAQATESKLSEPNRGSFTGYEKVRDQARIQVESRAKGRVLYELIQPPEEQDFNEPVGLARLPHPSPGDVFLDLEGDRLAPHGGRDYLFGFVTINPAGEEEFQSFWADNYSEERQAFEEVIDFIIARLERFPEMHVYHYAPYEVIAFKRLMGRYATREREVDLLLRGKRFVDLYQVVRQGVRVGIEQYSIKNLETLYGFERQIDLKDASRARRRFEQALELDRWQLVTPKLRETVKLYNKDDCVSTHRLRNRLESLRDQLIKSGQRVERPELLAGEAPDEVDQRAQAVEQVRSVLLAGVPDDPAARSTSQQANFQLAFLLDWHRREAKVGWWEYFRLLSLPEDELLDEPKAVAGLEYITNVGVSNRSVIRRFSYPPQEFEVSEGDKPMSPDGKAFGEIIAHDPLNCILDIKVGPSKQHEHPTALIVHTMVPTRCLEDALLALGRSAVNSGGAAELASSPERALLMRETPALGTESFSPPSPREATTVTDYAVEIVTKLNRTLLAIQGPPGAGKTYTGAKMIVAAVRAGLNVGVTATSHKVISNLLEAVVRESREGGSDLAIGHKVSGDIAAVSGVTQYTDNKKAEKALIGGDTRVLGGTPWLWARPEFEQTVDLLFVDEAGQVSLANALAVARSARNLVLLGDPQQLEQPTKGSHPEGAGLSALQHVLGEQDTMPADLGLFLPTTWRMAPSICRFTSDLFYSGQLSSRDGMEKQALTAGPFSGNGLWLREIEHTGNTNASEEEAIEVERLVHLLLQPEARWRDASGVERRMTTQDIRIVAPFNAQVNKIHHRLEAAGLGDVPTGTVDMFQGQEAAVVIYSLASSTPEDAPRGMEFLYSPNRINVATSRARCAVILVASQALFEPDCQTPRQMRLANALCRYRELATEIKDPT